MKCHDCGVEITEENMNRKYRRDICVGCWQTRADLVCGKIVPITSPDFKLIQRKMAEGRGTAKKYIDSLLKRKKTLVEMSLRRNKIRPCPKCGSTDIAIYPIAGGGPYGPTEYEGICENCLFKLLPLGKDGTKRSAKVQWNRYCRDLRAEK